MDWGPKSESRAKMPQICIISNVQQGATVAAKQCLRNLWENDHMAHQLYDFNKTHS